MPLQPLNLWDWWTSLVTHHPFTLCNPSPLSQHTLWQWSSKGLSSTHTSGKVWVYSCLSCIFHIHWVSTWSFQHGLAICNLCYSLTGQKGQDRHHHHKVLLPVPIFLDNQDTELGLVSLQGWMHSTPAKLTFVRPTRQWLHRCLPWWNSVSNIRLAHRYARARLTINELVTNLWPVVRKQDHRQLEGGLLC